MIGFNLNQQASWRERDYIGNFPNGIHVTIDNPKMAKMLVDLGHTVIYRHSLDDNDFFNHWSPENLVNKLHSEAPIGAYLQLGNEPPNHSHKELAKFTLDAMKYANRLGRKLVILNFSVLNPSISAWISYNDCFKYAKENGHLLGVHTYINNSIKESKEIIKHVDYIYNLSNRPNMVINEIGYVKDFNPHNGWLNNISSEEYANMLNELYNMWPDADKILFSLDKWHNFGIIDDTYLKDFHIEFRFNRYNLGALKQLPLEFVRIRSTPELISGNIIGSLRKNQGILFRRYDLNWYQVNNKGVIGYIHKQAGKVIIK